MVENLLKQFWPDFNHLEAQAYSTRVQEKLIVENFLPNCWNENFGPGHSAWISSTNCPSGSLRYAE